MKTHDGLAGRSPGKAAEGLRVKRSVSLQLGPLARRALAGEGGEAEAEESVPLRVERAIRCYLNDKGSAGPGWAYPGFLHEDENGGKGEKMWVSIDDALWSSLEREAVSQGVSAQQMVEHAALYFAAEVNAGRITQRILDELDEE